MATITLGTQRAQQIKQLIGVMPTLGTKGKKDKICEKGRRGHLLTDEQKERNR